MSEGNNVEGLSDSPTEQTPNVEGPKMRIDADIIPHIFRATVDPEYNQDHYARVLDALGAEGRQEAEGFAGSVQRAVSTFDEEQLGVLRQFAENLEDEQGHGKSEDSHE